MPGNGKSPRQFALEKQACESKGHQMASKFRHDRALKDTLTIAGGMALGAALGAITSAPYSGVGTGAAIGAAAGGVVGTGQGAFDTSTPQGAFDQAYWKCMIEAGNIVKTPSGEGIPLRVYTN
jgi:hypothetical protein